MFARALRPASGPKSPAPVIPVDWKRIELTRYTFSVPPDIRNQAIDRTDSEKWHDNGTIKLACDYGDYSTDLQAYANQPEWRRVVSYRRQRGQGRNSAYERWRCALGTAKTGPILHSFTFPHVLNGRSRLTCTAYCVDSIALFARDSFLDPIRKDRRSFSSWPR